MPNFFNTGRGWTKILFSGFIRNGDGGYREVSLFREVPSFGIVLLLILHLLTWHPFVVQSFITLSTDIESAECEFHCSLIEEKPSESNRFYQGTEREPITNVPAVSFTASVICDLPNKLIINDAPDDPPPERFFEAKT